jgi:tetratricopeptide (TPR) repeat protein
MLNLHWRFALGAVALAVSALVAVPAQAQAPQADNSASAPLNSALDTPLFYQLLIGEMVLRQGDPGSAFEIILDAARRSSDEGLFRRAVDIAVQAGGSEQALAAARAWRAALPESLDPLRLQLQLLAATGRLGEAGEPLSRLLGLTPNSERPGLIAALPRFLQRAPDHVAAAELLEKVLQPYAQQPELRVPARVAMARSWLAAAEPDRALVLAVQAAADDPAAPGPVLVAMELMATRPDAERIVLAHLERPDAEPALRLEYSRLLTVAQRYVDATRQLQTITQQRPQLAAPYLTLGALYLELHQPKEGEAALTRYLELAAAEPRAAEPAAADDEDEDSAGPRPGQGAIQAKLMLAQSAEQRGDFATAERWLAQIDDPQRALEVQTRRASILARQGRIPQARELIQRAPERTAADARAKLNAEAGVLRDVKRYADALAVLAAATQRFPDDADLLYEQAMMAEKIDKLDEMERLLRRVIELKPDNAHAHNALGYSLADRSQRLPEAQQLIRRALELSPGDAFITDSLGWVEFRLGNREEAIRLLQRAYSSRPDPEIAAHLGEVLWAAGQQDEARKVWREARSRDAANDVLRETLARLKVDL